MATMAEKRRRREERKRIAAEKKRRQERSRQQRSVPVSQVVDLARSEMQLRKLLTWILMGCENRAVEVPLRALAESHDAGTMVVVRKVAEGLDGAPALRVELMDREAAAALAEASGPGQVGALPEPEACDAGGSGGASDG